MLPSIVVAVNAAAAPVRSASMEFRTGLHIVLGGNTSHRTSLLRDLTGASPKPTSHAVLYDDAAIEKYRGALDIAKLATFVPADPLFDGALTVRETLEAAERLAPGAVSVRQRKQALELASGPADAGAADAAAPGSAASVRQRKPAALKPAAPLADAIAVDASAPVEATAAATVAAATAAGTTSLPRTTSLTKAAMAYAASSSSTLDTLLSALTTWLQPYGGSGVASSLGRMGLQDVADVRVSQLHPHQRRILAAAEAIFHGPRVLACEGTFDDLPPAAQAALASTVRAWAVTTGMVVVISASSSISDAALAEADQLVLLASPGAVDAETSTTGAGAAAASAPSSSSSSSARRTSKTASASPAIIFTGTLQAATDLARACRHLLPAAGRTLLPEAALTAPVAAGVASAGSAPAIAETAPQQQSPLALGTTAAALALLVELHARDVAAAAAARATSDPASDKRSSSTSSDIGDAVDVPASLPSWVGQLWVQARLGHGKGGARAGTLVAFCLLLQRQARAMLREPLRWFVPKLLICLAFGCFLGSMYDHPVITNFTPKVSLASYICVILTSSAGFEIPAFIEMTKRSHVLIDRRWVPAWAVSVASTLLSLPVSVVGSILFAAPIYYMVGYANSGTRFAFFWLITLLVDVAVTALVRWLGAFLLRPDPAKAINGVLVLFYLFCGGFLLLHPKMNKAMESIYWTNPYAYALRAIMNNEWDAQEYQRVIPVPNGHGGYAGMTLQQYFSGYVSMDMGTSWRLGSMAFLIGYALLFAAVCLPLTIRCKRLRAAAPAVAAKPNAAALGATLARVSSPSGSGVAAAPLRVAPTTVQFSGVHAMLPTQPLGAWWDPLSTHRSAAIHDVSFTARTGEVALLHAPDVRTIAVARRMFEGRVAAAWHKDAAGQRATGGCVRHALDAAHRLVTELSGRDHDVHAKAGKITVQADDAAGDAAAVATAAAGPLSQQKHNALLAPSLLAAACTVVKAPYAPFPAGLTVEEAVTSYVSASVGYASTDVAARVQQVLSLVGLDLAADRKARADALDAASWQAAALALAHAVCSHRSVIVIDASVSAALLKQSAVAESLMLGCLCRRVAAAGFTVVVLTTDALAPKLASLVHAHSVVSLTGQPTAAIAHAANNSATAAAASGSVAPLQPAASIAAASPGTAFVRWALAAPALQLKAFSRQAVRLFIQRNLVHLAVTLFVGTLFFDLTTSDVQGSSGIVTLYFLGSNFAGLLVLGPTIKVYQAEKPRVARDVAAGTYPLWAYVFSSAVAELAWSAVVAAIWTLIPFAMAGQLTHVAAAGASAWLAGTLCVWGYALIAMVLAAAAPNLSVAAYMEQCTITVMSILTGVFVPAPQMPATWNWLHEALVSSHAFKSVLANGLYCDPHQNGGPCPTIPVMANGVIVNVDRYAYFAGRYGFAHADRWWHCALAAIICGVTAVVALAVWQVAVRPRHRVRVAAKLAPAASKQPVAPVAGIAVAV